jgi:hypothetical protein
MELVTIILFIRLPWRFRQWFLFTLMEDQPAAIILSAVLQQVMSWS